MIENQAGRIIVVDDNDVFRNAMEAILSESGYKVAARKYPRTALEELQKIPVEQLAAVIATTIIFVDMRMMGMTGIEFIEELLSYFTHLEVSPPSIVGITGDDTADFASQLSQIGQKVGDHEPVKVLIRKPFEVDVLLATIANILSTNNSVNESS